MTLSWQKKYISLSKIQITSVFDILATLATNMDQVNIKAINK
jgi:hypothetical protein